VASKLTRLGHTVIGVDADEHLIALAREEDTETRFFVEDLSTLDLRTEQEFHCVVMAGNVVPYLADGTLPRVIERLAAHLAPGGYLVAGFGLAGALPENGAAVDLRVYDRLAEAAGLSFIARYSTWEERPFAPGDTYAVTVHRRVGG
jgi:predicted TPR repeat methyltransferase